MSVLEALADHYGRLRARGEAPPFGYARKRIGYAVVLSPAGESGAVIALSDGSAQSPSGHVCEVPHPVRRTSKPAANFLWDKPAYVFGVKRHASTRRLCPAEGEHRVFAALHESLLAHSDDEGLKALLGFIRAWDPQHYECLPHAQAMLDRNVVFRFAGDEQWLHERPASRAVWTEHLSRDRGTKRVCLVTGAQAPIARVHPSVKGVRGTHSAGAVLVTSNNETLESYGQIQGETASVSIEAAFAYTTALNALLAPDRRRRFQIGDMTLVFWAHTPGDAHAGLNAEALLFHAIAEGESAIAHTLESVARGEPLAPTTPPVPAATRFHLLGLAPNVGRLSVRLWHADTFGGFVRRLVEHWMDMRLEPAPWREPPSARRLLLETARKRRSELVPPVLGAALLRAILTGGRYPLLLRVRQLFFDVHRPPLWAECRQVRRKEGDEFRRRDSDQIVHGASMYASRMAASEYAATVSGRTGGFDLSLS